MAANAALIEQVSGLPASRFAMGRYAVKMEREDTGEAFWLVSNNTMLKKAMEIGGGPQPGEPVFLGSELLVLQQMGAFESDAMEAVFNVKKHMPDMRVDDQKVLTDIIEGRVMPEKKRMTFEEAKNVVIEFGKKYPDQTIDQIASTREGLQYLDWMMGQDWLKRRYRHVHEALEVYLDDAAIAHDLSGILEGEDE